MNKYFKIAVAIIAMSSLAFCAGLDSLTISLIDCETGSAVSSAWVKIDTAGVVIDSSQTSGGSASFVLSAADAYTVQLSKAGYYSDSLVYTIGTLADTNSHEVLVEFCPFAAKPCVVAHIIDECGGDTIASYADSIKIDVVNVNDDTLLTGYTDTKGVFAFDVDTLTKGATYWAYATDPASVFNSDYVVFTWDADSPNVVIPIQMDSTRSVTVNTVTAYLYDVRGSAAANIACEVSYSKPIYQGSGANTTWFTSSNAEVFYSNTDGLVEIKVPDNSIVDITIRRALYASKFYCTQDTVLGQIGVQ